MTDEGNLGNINPSIAALYTRTREALDRLSAAGEANQIDSDEARQKALDELTGLRAELEATAEADEESEMTAYDGLYGITAAIDDLELYWVLDLAALPDPIRGDSTRGAPSLLAGDTLWERLADWMERSVPWREVTLAMSDVMDMEATNEQPEDDQEAAFMEAAVTMARDYLVHDWRWHEGRGVLSRFREASKDLSDEERAATEVMERSHYDLYRVSDVDQDRGVVSLLRIHDDQEVSVEVMEDVLDVLAEGDGLLARVYMWSDGAELGAFLPVDAETLDMLEADMNELLDTDMSPPETPNRTTKLKVFGYLLVSDLLFPEDDEDDDDAEGGPADPESHEGHDHGPDGHQH